MSIHATDGHMQRLRTAARGDDPDAWSKLAIALVHVHQVDEAFELHTRAAARGHVVSQMEAARMQLYGIVGDADPAAAVEGFECAEAAGAPQAGYYLALIALAGHALARDTRINVRMQTAVDAGFTPALRAAAVHFGRRPDPRDQARCVELLGMATRAGDEVAAQLLVARLHRGEGVARDPQAAARLLAQLTHAGHAPLPEIATPTRPESALVCPPGVLAFEETLLGPTPVELAARPRVQRIDGLLSADECRLLIACARPVLRPSQAVDPETGLPLRVPLRTSSDAPMDPVYEDFALRCVQLRIAAAARTPLVNAEHLTVLRYAPGQEYRPHRDYLPAGAIERDHPGAGNRSRTICVYLNQVEAGGSTEFPHAAVSVDPVPGRAVVFDNLLPDGSPDTESLHAGTPVQRGEKWLATLWLRQRPYRDY